MALCRKVDHDVDPAHDFGYRVGISDVSVNEGVIREAVEIIERSGNSCIRQGVEVDNA